MLDALDLISSWYRDLVVAAAGAPGAVQNSDRLADLESDALSERSVPAERAAEACRELWRNYEELNLQQNLALEALFITLRREFGTGLLAPA